MINKGITIETDKFQNVYASAKGKIVFVCDNLPGFGKTIIIDHLNGFMTVYAGASKIFAKVGDTVQQGTAIAETNASRGKKTNLHFHVRKGYIAKNPYFYLSS